MTNRSGEVIPAPDADLCLNFANTRYWRGSATPTEDLHSLDDLLRWAETAERLPDAICYLRIWALETLPQHSATASASATSGGSGSFARFHTLWIARCICALLACP